MNKQRTYISFKLQNTYTDIEEAQEALQQARNTVFPELPRRRKM